jgi:hypothetical protein
VPGAALVELELADAAVSGHADDDLSAVYLTT